VRGRYFLFPEPLSRLPIFERGAIPAVAGLRLTPLSLTAYPIKAIQVPPLRILAEFRPDNTQAVVQSFPEILFVPSPDEPPLPSTMDACRWFIPPPLMFAPFFQLQRHPLKWGGPSFVKTISSRVRRSCLALRTYISPSSFCWLRSFLAFRDPVAHSAAFDSDAFPTLCDSDSGRETLPIGALALPFHTNGPHSTSMVLPFTDGGIGGDFPAPIPKALPSLVCSRICRLSRSCPQGLHPQIAGSLKMGFFLSFKSSPLQHDDAAFLPYRLE